MEIERKFKVREMPAAMEMYPHSRLEQGYLTTDPVIRIRRDGDRYILTYKGRGLMAREEYNLPLTAEAYAQLLPKAEGRIITKTRYRIPLGADLTAELDVFEGDLAGLVIVEVEFPDLESAEAFAAPEWFGEEVTEDPRYHNSYLSDPANPLP